MHPDIPLLAVIGPVLRHTPLYVWAILAGLIALGWLQSRTLRLSRARLLVSPGIFCGRGCPSSFIPPTR